MTVIGVISDTHGLLRPEAVAALAGVHRIIHAGDVGDPAVIRELERIAPVHAVRGNVDEPHWPESLTLTVEDARLHILHIIAEFNGDPASFQAIISGHSHRHSVRREGSTLFLNPGSAGPRRFRLPVTLARMVVDGAGVDATIVPLLP